MSKLSWFGVFFSGLYLLCLILISYTSRSQFGVLAPNEWGDFLAGVFGPLAFFWLVLGFFQQGRELQHSVDALRLQAEELKNSVSQQKAMVGITEKQLNLDIEVRNEQNRLSASKELPLIRILGRGHSSMGGENARRYNFSVLNLGPDATEVAISIDNENYQKGVIRLGLLTSKETRDFSFTIPFSEDNGFEWNAIATILSENIRGQFREQTFRIGNCVPEILTCDPENQ